MCDSYVSPALLTPLLPNRHHAYYLIATQEFQLFQYSQREFIHAVLAKTSNKELAWQNWMARDQANARALEKAVSTHDLEWQSVDGSISIETTISTIIQHFKKSPCFVH